MILWGKFWAKFWGVAVMCACCSLCIKVLDLSPPDMWGAGFLSALAAFTTRDVIEAFSAGKRE